MRNEQRRTWNSGWWIVFFLAVTGTFAINPSRARAQADECLLEIEAEGQDLVIDDNDTVQCCSPYCTTDGRRCTFSLRVCPNRADGTCTGADLKKVVAKSKCGGTRGFRLKPGTSSACGAFTDVKVKTKKHGQKAGTCKLNLNVKSKGRPARKDVDKVNLSCDPAFVCSTTTTTSTSTSTSTSTTTMTLAPGCGDGVVQSGLGEQCDPPCGGGCGAGQLCDDQCHCVAQSACTCGANDPQFLKFTTEPFDEDPLVATGAVDPLRCVQCKMDLAHGGCTIGTMCTTDADCPTGHCRGPLIRGGLYFGSGTVPNPLPAAIPDLGTSFNKTCCSGNTLTLAATAAGDNADITAKTCSSAGCFFGAPLPILNGPGLSTCVINTVAYPSRGNVECTTGASEIDLPLTSTIYLTGDLLDGRDETHPDIAGIQPCPVCTGGTCKGGSRHGMPCTAGTTALTEAYPTSQDCPVGQQALGSLPIPFFLTTGTQTKTAADLDGAQPQLRTYCGFCRDPDTQAFEGAETMGPAVPCTSNADCTRGVFTVCQQMENGAFGNTFATTITENGSPGGDLTDRQPHDATLVSVFCIPPTYSGLVDPAAGLPGPGAVSLPGQAQLLP